MKILWLGRKKALKAIFPAPTSGGGMLEAQLEAKYPNLLTMSKDDWDWKKLTKFNPDVVLDRGLNEPKYVYYDEMLEIKKRFPKCLCTAWLIDTHFNSDFYHHYNKILDKVFVAIGDHVSQYKNSFWLPLYHKGMELPKKQKKIYTLGFVGNVSFDERKHFLDEMKREFGELCHFTVDYETVYETMSKCQIMLNISARGDLNSRTFDALACGCQVVTNYVPDIDRIKGLRKVLNIYKDETDAKQIIRKLLKSKHKDNSNFIKNGHLLVHRINSLQRMLESGKQEEF